MNGRRICRSNGLSCLGRDAGTLSEIGRQSQPTEGCFVDEWWYGMICHRSWSTRQSYHLAADLHRVLLQLWTFWTLSRCGLTFFTETIELLSKAMQSLIRNWRIFNAPLHVQLENNWTIKFKLLYLLHHVSCFNEICGTCCVTLTYKVGEFGSNSQHHCWNTEVF